MNREKKPHRNSGATKHQQHALTVRPKSQGEEPGSEVVDGKLSSIPAEMRDRSQWVGFRVQNGSKTPVVADNPSENAKCNAPATWRPFEIAVQGLHRGDYHAVAYALDGDFVGVDVDHCMETDGPSQLAKQVIEHCHSYTEKSVSGDGVHIILRGALPRNHGRKVRDFEVYGRERFFICTGDRMPDTPAAIAENPEGVKWVLDKMDGGAEKAETTETSDAIGSARSVVSAISAVSAPPQEVIRKTLPQGPGERNDRILALARGLRFNCAMADTPVPEIKPIVREWYQKALPEIRTKDFDTTWADFVHAWDRARVPLGDVVSAAWQRALANLSGSVVDEYDSGPVRRLVSLCRELAALSPDGRFFLSSHDAGRRLGVKSPQVLRWLRMLAADEVLKVVKPGNSRRATRYRWLGELDGCHG
ncbi:hypothetical protein ACFLSJ_07175 [Verrucomicrobiota bacterium]